MRLRLELQQESREGAVLSSVLWFLVVFGKRRESTRQCYVQLSAVLAACAVVLCIVGELVWVDFSMRLDGVWAGAGVVVTSDVYRSAQHVVQCAAAMWPVHECGRQVVACIFA